MQQKSIALCIIFSILTCGIYGIYWFVCLTDEANELSGDQNGASGGMAFLFSLITCGIYAIYWNYRMGEKISAARVRRGMPDDPSLRILYLVLSIFGLSIISWALMQNEINQMLPGNEGRD